MKYASKTKIANPSKIYAQIFLIFLDFYSVLLETKKKFNV